MRKSLSQLREFHKNVDRLHGQSNCIQIKHIYKDEKKIICPMSQKEFTQHHKLKLHIIKNHEEKETAEKGIKVEQIVGPLYGGPKQDKINISFEEIKDHQALFINFKVSKEIFDIVMRVSLHCPLQHKLMYEGIKQVRKNFDLIYTYESKVWDDVVFRIWRYKNFEEEFALAQQFNYEYQIFSLS